MVPDCKGVALDGTPRVEAEDETSPPSPPLTPLKTPHRPDTSSGAEGCKWTKCTCGKCSRCVPSPSGEWRREGNCLWQKCLVLFSDWIWNGKNFVKVSTREWKMVSNADNCDCHAHYWLITRATISNTWAVTHFRVTPRTVFSTTWWGWSTRWRRPQPGSYKNVRHTCSHSTAPHLTTFVPSL